MKRKVYEQLLEWKSQEHHKPLILNGVRQCGKTYVLKEFGRQEFDSLAYVSCDRNVNLQAIYSGDFDVARIIQGLSALTGVDIIPGKTLIFLDEVQAFPQALEALKYFCEDAPEYHIVVAGSLLGVALHAGVSFPVGKVQTLRLFPMDFEEFLWAKGYGDDTVENLLSHMKEFKPFSELEMNVFHSLFLDYNILGGMPAVVAEYIERNTFEGSLDTQKQLIADYKEDIRKYATGIDQTRIINVFNRVAPQLARENKKFQISKVATGARFRDYRGCAEWLSDAGMVNICYCMEFPELPLGGNYEPDTFKLYFADTGLLVSMLDDESQEDLRANKNLGVYKGALYENMVGEALIKQGYKLFYYKKEDSTLEADFFIRSTASLIPVEVKAKSGRAKSMKTLIASDHYPDIRYGIKLSKNNIGHEDRIYTFPYFCTFLLKRFMAGFHAEEEAE